MMFTSMKFSDSVFGIKNALPTGLLRDSRGVIWAVEGFNVYSLRHFCINIKELTAYNGLEDTALLISTMITKGF